MTTQALLDALHAELLIEVGELARSVDTLKAQLPDQLDDIKATVQAVQEASRRALSEFEAMGHGLMAAMREQAACHPGEAAPGPTGPSASGEAGSPSSTRMLWLVAAIGTVNTGLLLGVLLFR